MKKKKITEISVNAATLAGQMPTFYNFRNYGLGSSTDAVLPIIIDFNDECMTGFYSADSTALNGPIAESLTVFHIKRSSLFAHQICFSINGSNPYIYIRLKHSTGWKPWKKITLV